MFSNVPFVAQVDLLPVRLVLVSGGRKCGWEEMRAGGKMGGFNLVLSGRLNLTNFSFDAVKKLIWWIVYGLAGKVNAFFII